MKVIHQVHTVKQARSAAVHGIDVFIAQDSEAGGQGMAAGVERFDAPETRIGAARSG